MSNEIMSGRSSRSLRVHGCQKSTVLEDSKGGLAISATPFGSCFKMLPACHESAPPQIISLSISDIPRQRDIPVLHPRWVRICSSRIEGSWLELGSAKYSETTLMTGGSSKPAYLSPLYHAFQRSL